MFEKIPEFNKTSSSDLKIVKDCGKERKERLLSDKKWQKSNMMVTGERIIKSQHILSLFVSFDEEKEYLNNTNNKAALWKVRIGVFMN